MDEQTQQNAANMIQAHLKNVEVQIQQLVEERSRLEQKIEELSKYHQNGLDTLQRMTNT